jgi:uncharacterized protein YdaU (DUF1376 family)
MHPRWKPEVDWYPFYPTDFRRDTLHLSFAEDGAYRRLIDEYMILRGPLPDDDAALARLLGVGLAEWMSVAGVVRKYFKAKNGRLNNPRCDRELAAQLRQNERYSQRGKKAAFAKYSKTNGLSPRRMLVPTTVHNKEVVHRDTSERAALQQGASDKGALKRPNEVSRIEYEDALKAKRENAR